MKQRYKWIWLAAMLVVVALLAGCGAGQDDVSDPLAGFGVDAVVPFATKDATAGPSASPSPNASATAPIASVTQGWQTEVVPTPSATSSTTYSQLARGNTGDAVKQLQQRLRDLGYLTDSADGNFGTNTETAVKRFQQAIGLTQTGVASSYMQQRLFAADAPRYSGGTVSTATPKPTSAPARPAATAKPSADLRYGDTGTAVRALQNRLKSLGYLTGSVDGIYGTDTRNAVMKFEAAYGRAQTGVATEAMQEVLYSDNARTYQQAFGSQATPTPTANTTGNYTLLSYGSKGDAVRRLQARLVELGYLQSTVTGNYMNKTVEAVSKFQKAIGLSETGVATASLQEALFSSSAPRYNASTPTATPTTGYTQLSFGSTGQAVAEMQQRLIDLGYLSGSADGLYYQATVEAVKAFQEALGWTPTGIASTDVLAVLFSSAAPSKTPASSTPSAYTELSIGSQGTAVYALQSRLVALGYAYGEPSSAGSYGPATAEAVKRFQQALGWEQTGVATVELQQRLYAADAPVYAPVASPTAAPVITPAPTTGLTTYQVLQEGNSGSDVAALQARLVELGYASGTPNGTYGQATADAVVRFQNMIGLYAQTDMGVATVSLQQILYSPYAPRYVEQNAYNLNAYEALEYGSSGNAVYNLKVRLQELGYLGASNPGYEDIFDENTLFAISNVQLMLGVQETDGVATPELQAFLFSDAALALAIQS